MPVLTLADSERLRGLRRMQVVALSLLVLAAVIYLLTHDGTGFWGYVNAGAEASMVGAMADWFAVTALFRHPLGLPVPHTALIPRKKDELAVGLEQFVGENFLSEEIIRDRLEVARPSVRFAQWLAEPHHSKRAAAEVAVLAAAALGRVREDHIADLVGQALIPRLREEEFAPLFGGLLGQALDDQMLDPLLDLALTELRGWLIDNPDTVAEVLTERAPWWSPQSVNDLVSGRIHTELVRWVEDIIRDPEHRARIALQAMLRQLADNLVEDPDTRERAERLKDRVLDDPVVLSTALSLWRAVRRALLGSVNDDQGVVRQRIASEFVSFAERLATDVELQERIDRMIADGAVFVVDRYGSEVTSVITHTIQKWDPQEASRRIELHVGRDLQFIRINGTLVGGLVGVLIHAVSQQL
ncbi:MAG: DUF445 domain-containing protein [Nocardioides sp.]